MTMHTKQQKKARPKPRRRVRLGQKAKRVESKTDSPDVGPEDDYESRGRPCDEEGNLFLDEEE